MVLTWGVVFLTSKPWILRHSVGINNDDTDRTPSEPITSLIACHQSIEMAPVALPPLFIATKKKERVLRLSQKESRDKGTNIFSSSGGSHHHHHALAVLSVVSSDSQSGFFRWRHWLRCLRVQQQFSESQRATFDHYLFFGSSISFVGQKRWRAKSSPTIVRTDASDSRGTMCQVRPWYCWILHSANEISGWRSNCLLRMSSMQAYVVHQQLSDVSMFFILFRLEPKHKIKKRPKG